MRRTLALTLFISTLAACGGGEKEKPAPEAPKKAEAAPATAKPAEPAPAPAPAVTVDRGRLGVFQPLPEVKVDNPALADLGRKLYHDTRLSKNQQLSCNSCHNLDTFGVDNKPVSPGHKDQLGNRNSPTVYNASIQFAQFWDGRMATVEEQATGPITNPVEMALADSDAVAKVLKSIPGYDPLFKAAFPGEADPFTLVNAGKAIGAFERQLLTPGRWDKFLAGDDSALSDAEKKGLNTFLGKNCTICHIGPGLGGGMFQKLGLAKPYDTKDLGRFEVTKNEADKFMFKVPLLRNVAKTGPYFHDGSVATLEDAVRRMGEYQLGLALTDEEVGDIVAFLGALTGDVPTELTAKPELPPSGPNTPAADPN